MRATLPILRQTKVEDDQRVHEGRVHAARRLWGCSHRALDRDNNGGTARSSNVTAKASEMDAAELLSVSGGCLVDKEVDLNAAFSAKVDCTAIDGTVEPQ
jgi:hypothetical protein